MTVHWLSPRFVKDGRVRTAGQPCFAECPPPSAHTYPTDALVSSLESLMTCVHALEKTHGCAWSRSCDVLHQASKSLHGLAVMEKTCSPFWLAELEDKGCLPREITAMPKCSIGAQMQGLMLPFGLQ